ncbi:MAG TPA: hypothetical protein VK607_10485 [Kofleriaceae bacterium]|nr:hypothetical protein [Kofleriaceae bacterium]
MTRTDVHIIVGLIREAARVAGRSGAGEIHSSAAVTFSLHFCTDDALRLVEEEGGTRQHYQGSESGGLPGYHWDVVTLDGVSFFGDHYRVNPEPEKKPEPDDEIPF